MGIGNIEFKGCLNTSALNVEFRKYGGSSFTPFSNVSAIAKDLQNSISKGIKLVVFCSAPAGLSESLKSMAFEISPAIKNTAIDSLVTCSDLIGAYLLQHSLLSLGIDTKVLTGISNGIHTDKIVSRSQVRVVDFIGINSGFEGADIIVIPGGQGSNNGDITWMGKNSSDLSCILQAIAAQQKNCSIYSDVDSVYNADPNMIENAKPYSTIDYDSVITAGKLGSKVLHYEAIELAKEYGVEVLCKLNKPPFSSGTQIGNYQPKVIIVTDKKAQLLTVKSGSITSVIDFLTKSRVSMLTCTIIKALASNQILIPMAYINYIDEVKNTFPLMDINGVSITAIHVISGKDILSSEFIDLSQLKSAVKLVSEKYIFNGEVGYV
jgi:aspartate kinase